jgi:hypothetical protein
VCFPHQSLHIRKCVHSLSVSAQSSVFICFLNSCCSSSCCTVRLWYEMTDFVFLLVTQFVPDISPSQHTLHTLHTHTHSHLVAVLFCAFCSFDVAVTNLFLADKPHQENGKPPNKNTQVANICLNQIIFFML